MVSPSVSPASPGDEALLGPGGHWTGRDRVLIPGGKGRKVMKLERVTPQGEASTSIQRSFHSPSASQNVSTAIIKHHPHLITLTFTNIITHCHHLHQHLPPTNINTIMMGFIPIIATHYHHQASLSSSLSMSFFIQMIFLCNRFYEILLYSKNLY